MIMIGQIVLGIYEVVDILGDGGQAEAVKATDQQCGRIVAIKHLKADPRSRHYPEQVARFKREGNIRLGHRAFPDPICYAEENGEHYIVMPCVEGVLLHHYIGQAGGKLDVAEAVRIMRAILDGLAVAHAKGFVHRDVKPQNMILRLDGQLVILDLGIAKDLNEATIAQENNPMGSPPYMAPEQILNPGTEDHRADLYACGAILYLMLVGQPHFTEKDTKTLFLLTCQRVPPSPRQLDPSIPRYLDDVCVRLLEKDPDRRFQSAAQVLQALAAGPTADGQARCHSCMAAMPADVAFCPTCGAAAALVQAPARCLACGAQAGEVTACQSCGRSFGHSNHRLAFQTGPLRGLIFRAPEGQYAVGRDCLSPRDTHISRRQIQVACLNGSLQVQDAGSTNKTVIDGLVADRPVVLATGQVLQIATNTAVYSCN